MTFKEWMMSLFGQSAPPDDPVRVILDVQQNKVADRLAAMRGVTRDEVLSESYRRARLLEEAESYRRAK